jgi:hypothetical protein
MKLAGNVACIGHKRNMCIMLVVVRSEGNHLKDLGMDWRIILKCIPRNGSSLTRLMYFRKGTSDGVL